MCSLFENVIDIACVLGTWLKEDVPHEVVSIEGYITHRNDRSHQLGGGIAAYVRDNIPHSPLRDLIDPNYASLWITLHPVKMPHIFSHITLGVLHHPPIPREAGK